jgi:hypothetical protein
MAQVVESLPSKHKALTSNFSTAKKKKNYCIARPITFTTAANGENNFILESKVNLGSTKSFLKTRCTGACL